MRISYNNLLTKSGATLSATNQNENWKVENIVSNYLELPFKALGNNSFITIELDNDYDIDHVAWGFHNLDTLTIRYLDNLNVEISNTIITLDQNRSLTGQFHYENVTAVRKIVFEMTTTDTILYIGGITTGNYFQFPNFQATPETPFNIRGTTKINGSGQIAGVRLRGGRSYNYSFKFTEEAKYFEFENVLRTVSNSLAHFVDIYEKDNNSLTFAPFWGVIEGSSDAGRKEFDNTYEMFFKINYRKVF